MTYDGGTDILDLNWPETNLGLRARNALCRRGYRTVDQVAAFYEECHDKQEISYIHGFGSRCDEVTREVFKQGDIELPYVDFRRWK